MDDQWAGIVTNAIAVLITSVGGPLFVLTIVPYNWLWRKISSRWTNVQSEALADAPDMHGQIDIILQNRPAGGFVNMPLGQNTLSKKREVVEIMGTAAMILIVLGLPVILITSSILSAGLATDTIAISNSESCGTYVGPSNSSARSVEYEQRAEAEARMYGSDCYGSSASTNNCNRFYSQNISYSVISADCPLKGDVCDTVRNGSLQLSTGLVSSAVLGINSKSPLFFSRTMTCSPIDTSDNYVSVGLSSQGEEQWEYWYGASLGAYTAANPVRKSAWEIKGYSTR